MKFQWLTACLAAGALMTAGCEDRHAREAAASPPTGPADRAASVSEAARPMATGRPHRPAPPQFHGQPLWADNRRGTAEENAHYQFEHRGADIGAKSYEDYLTRVHGFFEHPASGVETVVRASNGDKLVYDPKANLFGVLRKDGAPRLLMRPATGRAYWDEQKAEASLSESRSDSTR